MDINNHIIMKNTSSLLSSKLLSQPLPTDKSKLQFGTEMQTKLVGQPVKGEVYVFAPTIDQFLKEHLNSLKKHIEQLSDKNYQDLYQMQSPDFVLLFIPIEPAFAIALNEDTTLYNKAFEKNIVIVTPSTLLATLRTIDSMWTNQKQQENAYEIARLAGTLYDKFEGFANDLISIGKKIGETKNSYDSAMGKLVDGNGNIVITIEKLKKMGAKAKKSLPENLLIRASKDAEENLE